MRAEYSSELPTNKHKSKTNEATTGLKKEELKWGNFPIKKAQ